MSYTDNTVYRMRECIAEYSEMAISLRNEMEEQDMLHSIAMNNGLKIPESLKYDGAKQEKKSNKTDCSDPFTLKLQDCIKEYENVSDKVRYMKESNKKTVQFLMEKGIELSSQSRERF